MARKIIAIRTKRPVFGNHKEFQIGAILDDGKTVDDITRSIGGLADVTSAGPAILGPNCPTFVITMALNKNVEQLAIPERLVDAIVFKIVKKGEEQEPEVKMSKEG